MDARLQRVAEAAAYIRLDRVAFRLGHSSDGRSRPMRWRLRAEYRHVRPHFCIARRDARGARLLNNARSSYSRPLARKRPPRIGRYETRRDVFNCPTWRVRRGATMDVKPMRAKNSAHFNRKGSAPLSSSLCSQSFCQTLPVHHCIPSNRPLGSLTNVPVAGGVGQRGPLHPSA